MTCEPHDEIYSLYGHTAIRIVNPQKDMDIAVNYGAFDSSESNFVLRFVFGLTDYMMMVYDYSDFLAEYRYFGSAVHQQHINMTSEEKRVFMAALAESAQPENIKYRYNYFYNNCTTKARDIIFGAMSGEKVVEQSGDNPLTVSKIASLCGVENSDKFISLEGVPLEKIPELVEEYTIFARVSPEQKEALVSAMQAKGHKVAMTGDGVNDILALRKADSSITFAKATEAAKSCSDVVLLDNDFSHLKEVVGEGRRVIGNIQRTSVLFLMKSIAIALFAFALIPFAKGQLWYSIESAYILEAAVIGTGGFLLSLESKKTPIRGSFISNINYKAVSAGLLAASAILLPIMMYRIPVFYGAEPLISPTNVRTMMTVLLLLAGFVVVLSMCVPFNKYRMFCVIAVMFVAGFLAMMLPTSYIGGQPTSGAMLAFDASARQTIWDSQLFREMFKPWNSNVVKELISDADNFVLIRVFVLISVPIYLFIVRMVDRNLDKKYAPVGQKPKKLDVGRLFLLMSSVAFIIQALFFIFDISREIYVINTEVGSEFETTLLTVLVIVFSVIAGVLNISMGIIGYKAWKTDLPKYKKAAFVLALVLLALTILSFVMIGTSAVKGDTYLNTIDNVVSLVITLLYIAGAIIVKKKNVPAAI